MKIKHCEGTTLQLYLYSGCLHCVMPSMYDAFTLLYLHCVMPLHCCTFIVWCLYTVVPSLCDVFTLLYLHCVMPSHCSTFTVDAFTLLYLPCGCLHSVVPSLWMPSQCWTFILDAFIVMPSHCHTMMVQHCGGVTMSMMVQQCVNTSHNEDTALWRHHTMKV